VDMPTFLVPLLAVLRRVFPLGVDSDQRRVLLVALWDQLSEENFGLLLSEFLDDEQVVVVDEAISALGAGIPAGAACAIMSLLTEEGWPLDVE
jgi:hypothetical protein